MPASTQQYVSIMHAISICGCQVLLWTQLAQSGMEVAEVVLKLAIAKHQGSSKVGSRNLLFRAFVTNYFSETCGCCIDR